MSGAALCAQATVQQHGLHSAHLHLLQGHKVDEARHDGAWLSLTHINLLHVEAAGHQFQAMSVKFIQEVPAVSIDEHASVKHASSAGA